MSENTGFRRFQDSLLPLYSKIADIGSALLLIRKLWTDDIDTRIGTITTTPVNPTDIVNKAYVDSVAAGVTVREVDGAPSIAGATIIEFDQADGFVVSNPGGTTVRIDFNPTATSLNVRELDGAPSINAVSSLQFDQSDGFSVTDLGGGAVRIDLTPGAFNLTVEEVDASPSLINTATIRFDQADGFVITAPAGGIARVDIDSATLKSAHALAPSTAQYVTLALDAGLSAESVLAVNPNLTLAGSTITLRDSTIVFNAAVFS